MALLLFKFCDSEIWSAANLKQNKTMGTVSKTGSRPGAWTWEKAALVKYGSLRKTRPEELQTYIRSSQVTWKAISEWFIFI